MNTSELRAAHARPMESRSHRKSDHHPSERDQRGQPQALTTGSKPATVISKSELSLRN